MQACLDSPPTDPTTADATIRHLTVCGRRIRVAIQPGDRSRTPLLMINGMGAPLETLGPLATSLPGREVIRFDVPGAGESPIPPHPYTMPMLAVLTAHMLTELGHQQVDVFGFSWGGMLAQQFAFQFPHLCHRLVLAATLPGTPMMPASLSVLSKIATPRRFNDPEYGRKVAGEVYGGAARTNPAPSTPTTGRTNELGYLFQQLALVGWGSHAMLPFLRQPTLVLAGDDDPIAPLANAQWMAFLLPRGRLHVLRDGHHFFRSSQEETSAAIREFLEHPA